MSTPFADDFNLITTNKRTHQRIINSICEWTESMGLKLKASKCKSLSIVSGKSTPISFTLNGTALETLDKDSYKFLGSTITFSGKQKETLKVIIDHFESRLKSIDKLLIRNEFKIKIYKDYLLPASRFILTVHTLTDTSLKSLDSLATRYLKSWLGLPPSATRAIIHVEQLTAIKSISHLYRESQTNAYINSKLKADQKVIVALDSRLARESEWQKKQSTIVMCDKTLSKVVNNNVLELDARNANNIKSEAKKTISEEMNQFWISHLKTLVVQGQFLTISQELNSDFNFRSLLTDLPRNILKFLSNACIDTNPTNVNLKRWKKRSNASCKLCSNKETLLHVLNNCKTMLLDGRYTWRHNSILNYIHELIASKYSDSHFKIFCDLPGKMKGISTIPTDIFVTSQKPDLCLVNSEAKEIILMELTVPFESNINSAHTRKSTRYELLINDLQTCGYEVKFYPIEIGSRGLISRDNVTSLKSLLSVKYERSKEFKDILKNLSKISIIASYCIFYSKFEVSWLAPEFIHF